METVKNRSRHLPCLEKCVYLQRQEKEKATREFPLKTLKTMKKTAFLYTVLAWMTTGCAMAQHPCRTDVLDTSYDGFLFDLPINIQAQYISNGYGYNFVHHSTIDSIAFIGSRYYSATPIVIHGIAVTAMDLVGSTSSDRYEGWLNDYIPIHRIDNLTFTTASPGHTSWPETFTIIDVPTTVVNLEINSLCIEP